MAHPQIRARGHRDAISPSPYQEITTFYGTCRSLIMFARGRQWHLYWASLIHCKCLLSTFSCSLFCRTKICVLLSHFPSLRPTSAFHLEIHAGFWQKTSLYSWKVQKHRIMILSLLSVRVWGREVDRTGLRRYPVKLDINGVRHLRSAIVVSLILSRVLVIIDGVWIGFIALTQLVTTSNRALSLI
jgi:hypothetical protein